VVGKRRGNAEGEGGLYKMGFVEKKGCSGRVRSAGDNEWGENLAVSTIWGGLKGKKPRREALNKQRVDRLRATALSGSSSGRAWGCDRGNRLVMEGGLGSALGDEY